MNLDRCSWDTPVFQGWAKDNAQRATQELLATPNGQSKARCSAALDTAGPGMPKSILIGLRIFLRRCKRSGGSVDVIGLVRLWVGVRGSPIADEGSCQQHRDEKDNDALLVFGQRKNSRLHLSCILHGIS